MRCQPATDRLLRRRITTLSSPRVMQQTANSRSASRCLRETHNCRKLAFVITYSHRYARHDRTVLSVSSPLQRWNWISDNSVLSSTENLKPGTFRATSNSHRHTGHDTDRTDQSRSVSCSTGIDGATAGRTPTQNALVWRSGRLSLRCLTRHRHDRLVLYCLVGGVNWT